MLNDEPGIRIILESLASSPLGRIRKAAFIDNSWGLRKGVLRVLGSYGIVYVLKGSGAYRDGNGLERSVRQGDVMLLFPDLGHQYGPPPGQRWSEFYIIFEGPVFDLWRQAGLLDEHAPVHHFEPIGYWLKRLQAAVERTPSLGDAHPVAGVCKVQQVLADMLVHLSEGRMDAQDREWLERACDILDAPLVSDAVQWRAIAGQMHTSYESFRKRFTRLAGMPPAKYRARKVIEYAIELMSDGTVPIKQVARKCGFCNEFHFSRRFKQIVGLSPRDFRRQLPR